MHPEQIEAVIDSTIEKMFGDPQTLSELHRVLKKSNVSSLREGESDAIPLNAGLFHSLFLSHARLAQLVGELASSQQRALERIDTLEKSTVAIQEAVINLQIRFRSYEETPHP